MPWAAAVSEQLLADPLSLPPSQPSNSVLQHLYKIQDRSTSVMPHSHHRPPRHTGMAIQNNAQGQARLSLEDHDSSHLDRPGQKHNTPEASTLQDSPAPPPPLPLQAERRRQRHPGTAPPWTIPCCARLKDSRSCPHRARVARSPLLRQQSPGSFTLKRLCETGTGMKRN